MDIFMRSKQFWLALLVLGAILLGCQSQPVRSSPTVTPLPFPMSQLQKQWGFALTREECDKILETQETCLLYYSSVPLQQPVWQQLLPKTDFLLVTMSQFWQGYQNMTDGGGVKSNPSIVAEQAGEIYTASTFHHLLKVNNIAVTEQNREQVAEAFALMTLPYYIENEILFSDAGSGDFTSFLYNPSYNYRLVAFTRLQSKRIEYYFALDGGTISRVKLLVFDYDNRNLPHTPVYAPQLNNVPYLPNGKEYVFGN